MYYIVTTLYHSLVTNVVVGKEICHTFIPTGASPPTSLSAQPTSPTSIKVSWTSPTSGPTVVGYRIYYEAEGSQDNHTDPSSVDIGASTTQHTLSELQGGIWYTITMVTKSQYLRSTVAGPVIVTYSKFTNYIIITISLAVLILSLICL